MVSINDVIRDVAIFLLLSPSLRLPYPLTFSFLLCQPQYMIIHSFVGRCYYPISEKKGKEMCGYQVSMARDEEELPKVFLAFVAVVYFLYWN